MAILGTLYYLSPAALPILGIGSLPVHLAVVMVVTAVAALALLVWREPHPVAVALAIAVLLGVSPTAFGAAIVAQEHVTRVRGRKVGIAVGLAMIATRTVGLVFTAPEGAGSAAQVEWILITASLVMATLVGMFRAETSTARQAAEDSRVDAVRLLERERIAREMHDDIAHRISLVALHAGALEYRASLATNTDPKATELSGMIRENAQAALDELRVMLGTLRGGGSDGPPDPPQPDVSDLRALVVQAQQAGQVITLQVDGDATRASKHVSRHAYRIVQEALTNARKHAPGAPVAVEVVIAQDVQVRVSNPLTAAVGGGGSGFGLVGVAERVEQVGGTLEHGVRGGDFVLDARLPTVRMGG